jgi:hypothetical protein
VPVPPALLETLNMVHGIRELHDRRGKAAASPVALVAHDQLARSDGRHPAPINPNPFG